MTAALAAVFSRARRITRDIDYATTIDREVFEVVLMLTRFSRPWFPGLPELMGEVHFYRRPLASNHTVAIECLRRLRRPLGLGLG